MKKEFTKEQINEKTVSVQEFFDEVRTSLKDVFVAQFHTSNDERLLRLHFPNGQVFVVAVWEEEFICRDRRPRLSVKTNAFRK